MQKLLEQLTLPEPNEVILLHQHVDFGLCGVKQVALHLADVQCLRTRTQVIRCELHKLGQRQKRNNRK